MASQSHRKGERKDGETIKRTTVGGREKVEIKPKALDIIWGGDQRYWKIPESNDGSAELLQVCWLEVSGSLELNKYLMTNGKYKINFIVSMKADAFGWNGSPVYLMAKVGANKIIWKSSNLSGRNANEQFFIPEDLTFDLKDEDRGGDRKLNFGLYEIWRGRWKGGLVIHQVEILPI